MIGFFFFWKGLISYIYWFLSHENLVIYFVNLWYIEDLIINLFQLNLNYKNLDFYFLRQGLGFYYSVELY